MIHVFTITDHIIKCGLIKIFYESLGKATWVMIFQLGIVVAMVSISNLLFPSLDSVMFRFLQHVQIIYEDKLF